MEDEPPLPSESPSFTATTQSMIFWCIVSFCIAGTHGEVKAACSALFTWTTVTVGNGTTLEEAPAPADAAEEEEEGCADMPWKAAASSSFRRTALCAWREQLEVLAEEGKES